MRSLASILVLLSAGSLYGQPAQKRFEVASIKPGSNVFSTKPERVGGRFRWTTQLGYLIGYANRLDMSRVSGPNVASIYSLETTFEPGASDAEVRQMIQSLLEERFRMKSHRATAEASGWALTVGKDGLKMRRPAVMDESPPMLYTRLPEAGVLEVAGRHVSMERLAQELGRVTRTPVWDKTGLAGDYSFSFRFAEDLGVASNVEAPSLSTALQELGLKLAKQKGLVETLVIDSIEEPSGN